MVYNYKIMNNRTMINIQASEAESYSRETFHCGNCEQDFEANVITWVDVSRTPQAKRMVLRWDFNIIQCTQCGCRHFSGTPFFFEDFEDGLLIAVFPRIPENRGQIEKTIKEKYGYYPVLEFFYDMTQIWTYLYFQEHYRANKNLRALSRIGKDEKRVRTFLRFLKEDPLMIDIREKLTESFFGDATDDELVELLGQAVYTVEGMLPWPRDRRCMCGGDLAKEFKCCGERITLDEHEHLLSRYYVIYCPYCEESLAGASCEYCGRVFTWKLGTVDSYGSARAQETRDSPAPHEIQADPKTGSA